MDKNSFSLSRPETAPRASTGVPEERPWNPPQRRVFSSHERRINQANARALAHFVDRLDRHDPPPANREDSKLHASFSNIQFGTPPTASQGCPQIEMEENASVANSADGSEREDDAADNPNDETSLQGGDDHASSQDVPSFSSAQEFLDSLWLLNGAPEKLQDFFDGMKEEVHHQVEELSSQKRTSAQLSRDLEALQESMKDLKEKEQRLELQSSKQKDELKAQEEQCYSLREENEKLRYEMQADRRKADEALEAMRKEFEATSRDLKTTKQDLREKDEAYELRIARLTQENENENKRREKAELESQVFKREIFELRKRSNEERRKWTAAREKEEIVIASLKAQNCSLTERTAMLEEAASRLKEENQCAKKNLSEVGVFLKNVSIIVKQIHRALCIHGHPDELSSTSNSQSQSQSQTTRKNCLHLEVFEEFSAELTADPSNMFVPRSARRYMEAMTDFFRAIVLKDVAHSQFVCSSRNALNQIDSDHQQIRKSFGKVLSSLKEMCTNLYSELPISWQRPSKVLEVSLLKIKELKEARWRVQEYFVHLDERNVGVKDGLQGCRELLASHSETLLKSKKALSAGFHDFHEKLLSYRDKRAKVYKTEVQKVRMVFRKLEISASTDERKLQEVQSSLSNEIAHLRALLTQSEGKLLKLSSSEAALRKSKEELVCSSKQFVAKEEELKGHIVALQSEKEKVLGEKKSALERVSEAEQAARKMSAKVTEALCAKQDALEAFVREKSAAKELRSKLAEVCETKGREQTIQGSLSLQRAPRVPSASASTRKNSGILDVASAGLASPAVPSREEIKKHYQVSAQKQTSASQQKEDPSTSDFCEINLIPKKTKRLSSGRQRKSTHSKRLRSNTTNVAASTISQPASDLNPRRLPRKSSLLLDGKPQTPSNSATGRDEEWDIDVVIGKDDK